MPRIVPVHWRTLERVVLATGFRFARQEGSHRSYTKPGVARPVVMPAYDEVPVAIIRNTLNTAGIARDEYFRRLEEARRPASDSKNPALRAMWGSSYD